ncbi:uncharacterized protein TNCV_4282761 [Trichonephila clavipes]|nr:uncharacterized protein TNCV_4282761 [Trichonephila clavipes]
MCELTTVTNGTISAPNLATRTLKQLAMDEANNFPFAAPVVLSNHYMDDIISGSESIEENRATKAIHQKNGLVYYCKNLRPIITWAKIFMQRMWLLELGWSDELPFTEEKEWR